MQGKFMSSKKTRSLRALDWLNFQWLTFLRASGRSWQSILRRAVIGIPHKSGSFFLRRA